MSEEQGTYVAGAEPFWDAIWLLAANRTSPREVAIFHALSPHLGLGVVRQALTYLTDVEFCLQQAIANPDGANIAVLSHHMEKVALKKKSS
jgi:hypothetical protein